MIEISLNKINKSYGFNPILKDFSFEIKSGERMGLMVVVKQLHLELLWEKI